MDNGRIIRTGLSEYFLFCLIEFVILSGKPNEVIASAKNLLSSVNHSTQSNIVTTPKSPIEIEEQVIQTETALQNEAEQRCTGKKT
jgi:hypothetical protein